MPLSVHRDRQGPDWPLGFISVVTPGTPVGFMSLVDPNAYDAPQSATSAQANEYTVRATEIMVSANKPAAHGLQHNLGNIYIVRAGVGGGSGNRDDYGAIFMPLEPGQILFFTAAALNRNVFNPYRYYIDADNAGDGALITLIIE